MSTLQEIAAGLSTPPPLTDSPIDDEGEYKPVVIKEVEVAKTKHVDITEVRMVESEPEPEVKETKSTTPAPYSIIKPQDQRHLITDGYYLPESEAPIPIPGATCLKVNPLRFLAAIEASSNEESRYYLNGFAIHMHGTDAWIVSTDGHMMLVQHVPMHPLSNFTDPATAIFKKIDFKMESEPKDPKKCLKNVEYLKGITKTTIQQNSWRDDAYGNVIVH